jgi:hypothetical protein
MTTYRVYVRGHGGLDSQPLPPSGHVAIDLITLGETGCTLSDEVADSYIYNHVDYEAIKRDIDAQRVIYWTLAQRDEWYSNQKLEFTQPALDITPYSTVARNLVLQGDAEIGDKCGVCYWDTSSAELRWLIELQDGKEILLSQILEVLAKSLVSPEDKIELYWTACMSARYWSGNRKKVSFNPKKK